MSWSGFYLDRVKLRVVLISEGHGLNSSHVKLSGENALNFHEFIVHMISIYMFLLV